MKKADKLEKVDCRYGAPHCRAEVKMGFDVPARCFHVVLDQGYDEGGAYWGYPNNVWCAKNKAGLLLFVRSAFRCSAKVLFQNRAKEMGQAISWIN